MYKVGKIYNGFVLDIQDPLNTGRYAIYIPEIMKSDYPGTKYVFCKNGINTYVRDRNPFTAEYFSYGSYTPLYPGTQVYVLFTRESSESGLIIGTEAVNSQPKANRDNYYLIYKTKYGSMMYVDDEKGHFHLQHENGASNIYMNDKSLTLQINTTGASGEKKRSSAIELDEDRVRFIIGNAVYEFGVDGFNMNMGDKAATYLNISRDGIHMQGNKFINISSDMGNLHLFAENTFLTGYNETHIYGSDVRLTGNQKAQISGNHVNIQSWFDTHIKGMNIGIEALIFFQKQATFSTELDLAVNNTFAPLYNLTSSLYANTTAFYGVASPTIAMDGMTLNNMGLAASLSGSIGTSISGMALALKGTFMGIGTMMLMNEPTGIMGAVSTVLTSTIAGTASPAAGPVYQTGAVLPENDPISGLVNKNIDDEEVSKKYVQPKKFFKY